MSKRTNQIYIRLENYEDKFSIINHEIKTPLNAIIGNVELMNVETDPCKQQKYVENISRFSTNLLNLVNENLETFKLSDSSEIILTNRIFLMNYLIETIYNTYYIQKNKKRFLFNLNNIYESVNADYYKFYQIITNLINNSIKFTRHNGLITISINNVTKSALLQYIQDVKYVTVSEPQHDNDSHDYIMFSVEDDGIGISPDNICDVFKKYEQVSKTKKNHIGIGLGLYLLKKIVDKMNGCIFVKSMLGVGTKIVVIIPVEVVSKKIINKQTILIEYDTPIVVDIDDQVPSLMENKITDKLTVYVADDNMTNLEIITDILETLNYDITTFTNGKDIYEHCKYNKPDIIFMDIHMPVMTGDVSVRYIRKLKNHKDTFIIAYTASVFDINTLKNKGFDEIINKPATIQMIKQTLMNYTPKK